MKTLISRSETAIAVNGTQPRIPSLPNIQLILRIYPDSSLSPRTTNNNSIIIFPLFFLPSPLFF